MLKQFKLKVMILPQSEIQLLFYTSSLLHLLWWPWHFLRPVAARKSDVFCYLAACHQSLVSIWVSSGQNWESGLLWASLSNVLRRSFFSTTFTMGWISKSNLLRCFPNPQWPVCRYKMVVWVFLSRLLVCSFCSSCARKIQQQLLFPYFVEGFNRWENTARTLFFSWKVSTVSVLPTMLNKF